MFDLFFNALQNVNDHYAQLLLLFIALISLAFAYNELVLKTRPYVVPDIVVEQKDGNWYFNVLLVNKGERPGIAQVAEAMLTIGDERYPTAPSPAYVLAPNERQKIFPVGHINEMGRSKILGHEYADNSVQIHLKIESRAINDKKFRYITTEDYLVDVSGDQPIIRLINEELN